MQPEPTSSTTSTAADDRPAGTSTGAAEPAPETTAPAIGSMADAFRAAGPEALKGRRAGRSRPTESAPPEESADDTASASKPGGDQAAGQPSRRGAAAAIKERDAEIERLAEERIAAQRKAEEADARVKALTEKAQASRRAALEQIGSDERFEALSRRKLRNEALSWEEDQELERMIGAREHAGTYWELAEQGHKAEIARGVAALVDEYRLDRDAVIGADLPAVLKHAVETTEARVRAETADRIKELEAELKGLRPLAAAARTRAPVVGGASDPGGMTPTDPSSPTDWFRTGLRAGAQRRPGAPARRSA